MKAHLFQFPCKVISSILLMFALKKNNLYNLQPVSGHPCRTQQPWPHSVAVCVSTLLLQRNLYGYWLTLQLPECSPYTMHAVCTHYPEGSHLRFTTQEMLPYQLLLLPAAPPPPPNLPPVSEKHIQILYQPLVYWLSHVWLLDRVYCLLLIIRFRGTNLISTHWTENITGWCDTSPANSFSSLSNEIKSGLCHTG